MLLFIFFLIGAVLAIGPWFVPGLGTMEQIVLTIAGTVVLLFVAAGAVVTRLYRKTSASLAFVRTGMGGAKVIKDGGTVVFPVVHQVIPVSLETMRLNVERRGPHALITKDNLRVDLSAEFYIKVQANTDDILQAARSLGARNVRPDEVSELVQEKLVSALRTVAATKELVELHAKRDEFASAVQEIVTHDLSTNGLTLESVTISALDQTDPTQLQERNVFDAQGLRKIAEITQKARVERNEIERDAERSLVEKDVETRKMVLDMERDQAEFEAEQKMKVANVQAAREREVAEFKIAQEELVARREIEKQKALQTAEVHRTMTVEQAEVDKTISLVAKFREQETAEIVKKQAVEVAMRAKEVAVAEKEEERATAQGKALEAESLREASSQKVLTVKVTAEAQREAEKKLIAAKQLINENKIREETEADVLAYMEVKKAEAERQAADLQYEAKLRLAEADAQSAVRRSEGHRAEQMVAVNVDREQVNVEQARVDVERQRLSNQQEFGGAALKFELEKLRIDADREVRVRTSEAMSKLMHGANVQLFGDPGTMTSMMNGFMRASGVGIAGDGLLRSLSPEAREVLSRLGMSLGEHLGADGHKGNGANGAIATNGGAPAADAHRSTAPVEVIVPAEANVHVTEKTAQEAGEMISNPYEFPERAPDDGLPVAAAGEFKILPDLQALIGLRDTLRAYEEKARSALDANPLESLLAVIAGGTLLYYVAERRTNDKVNNLWDALEYTSTCASVGYSEIYASTPIGKLVASTLFLLGPSLTERALDPPVSLNNADEPATGTAILAEKLEAILMELKQLNSDRTNVG